MPTPPKTLSQPLASNSLYPPSALDSSGLPCGVYSSSTTSPDQQQQQQQQQHKDAATTSSPGPSGHNSAAASEAGSGTEYSPDSKPNKTDSNHEYLNSNAYRSASPSYMSSPGFGNSLTSTSQASHQLPGYPYIGGADYGSALFHSANMFKAATLARVTKKRSSTGRHAACIDIVRLHVVFLD